MPIKKINKTDTLLQSLQPIARPFLKWAGGKSQLLSKFSELYPEALRENKIKHYYEPFLGSGAVYFHIAQNFAIEKAWLYDTNPELIITYQVIQQHSAALIDFLKKIEATYLDLKPSQREKYFYDQRANYNQQRFNTDYNNYSTAWIARAAQLIFLNRTCFNGLYRVNAKGEFNTPTGRYENPTICDEYNLLAVARVLENATIKRADYKQVKRDLKKKSFVYFDPPYRPISKTASFKAYGKIDFTDADQTNLADLFSFIHQKGEYVMLSNSDPQNIDATDNFFDKLYKEFNIERVPARRMINSNASLRGVINEIVVTNYPVGPQ